MAMIAAPGNECERLRSELLQALKEQAAVSSKLQSAKKVLKKVRRERNGLQQAATDKRMAIKKASHEYAKATCHALCEEVYNLLPREVRNIIYSHIHVQHTLDISSNHFTSRALTPATGWLLHHIWDPAFVTTEVHMELIEQYFRATTFHFRKTFEHIAKFRATDPWKTGYIPAQFPTNIAVTVACKRYVLEFAELEDKSDEDDGWNDYHPWGSVDWANAPNPPQKTSSDLLADLDVLFGFHHATKFEITVVSRDKRKGNFLKQQDWMCKHLIPLMTPTLQRLRAQGHHVCIVLCGSSRLEYHFPNFVVESFMSLEAYNAQFEEFMSKGQETFQQAKLEAMEEAEGSDPGETDYTDSE
ncbi:hypothetical protein EKO04_004373 [Ascochyta lentis]|uniref:Uncharacterized protein n=1 Tax=Ascochyta lentis TaxID=205686 RepID=A0A8H7MJY9_9PLEO|nr:hypothetical protein EKO04_004373 [Ascochyta lentis]